MKSKYKTRNGRDRRAAAGEKKKPECKTDVLEYAWSQTIDYYHVVRLVVRQCVILHIVQEIISVLYVCFAVFTSQRILLHEYWVFFSSSFIKWMRNYFLCVQLQSLNRIVRHIYTHQCTLRLIEMYIHMYQMNLLNACCIDWCHTVGLFFLYSFIS